MCLRIHFERTQHPVGHGGFHSACLYVGGQPHRYAYDCGSRKPNACDREVDKLSNGGLDFLFISHVHEDHVSGIPALLRKVSIHTVVMPMLLPIERAYAFALSVAGRGERPFPDDEFYIDFLLNPARALTKAAPGGSAPQVLLVKHADGGAPGGHESESAPRSGEDGPRRGLPEGWRFIGKPNLRELTDSALHGAKVFDDTGALAVVAAGANGTSPAWLLAPYVENNFNPEGLTGFERTVRELTGVATGSAFDDNALKRLLEQDKRRDFRAAFKKLAGDLNLTSMCLYSGPDPGWQRFGAQLSAWRCHSDPFTDTAAVSDCLHYDWSAPYARVGWLGTGDLKPGNGDCGDRVLSHYGRLLDEVSTLVVPHHGAQGDLDKRLFSAIRPWLCVIAARSGDGEHPSPQVCRAIVESGARGVIVTEDPRTIVYEQVWLDAALPA